MKTTRRKFIQSTFATATGLWIIPRHVLGKGFVVPSDQILVGIIGAGMQGRGLQNAICNYPQLRLISASDVEIEKRQLLAKNALKKYGRIQPTWNISSIKLYENYHDLLHENELNAVVISTPDHWHAKQALEAMDLGLHVFCEKPISHTIDEGRKMADSAKKNNIVFQTGSMQRSWKHFRHVSELIRNNYLGEIKKIVVYVGDPPIPCNLPEEPVPKTLNWDGWLGPAPVRPYNAILSPSVDVRVYPRWRWYEEYGGGIVADWGAHMFDIAQWALGTDHTGPVKIIPPFDNKAKRGLKMYYENGIEMVHDNQKIFDDQHGIEFFGTEGKMKVARGLIETEPESIANIQIKDDDIRLYQSDDHLLDWIHGMKTKNGVITDAEVGHRTATICQLVNIGYKLNQPLEWNPIKERFIGNSKANQLRNKKYRKPFKI
ncbi:MAG: Gfo/Idh/MocA family oxidoreductase [Flavobacteriaceae bacterium]|nr:Gfo/Idh/MocA family oxidoreductase [Flavobacteriaceae bacterium]MCY4267119.1 Gfo/Idh/MocA family oxidoreductase [Flavobacteriaceae bacterium]MCY4299901.1 Gfo/Idh/MocA family oxidoreductase [Flavobacteriaceae bacterium]